ncbi:MAG: type transport system permease protein [Eubacteriales bacterium]|nr:type transport system permease protein [Eubacteriales bacterium]MDN5363868.1 type transport system permease protein [Eubacteriales bacterium]
MGRGVLVLAGRIVRQLVRDKRTFALIFVVPAVIMTLLYFLMPDEVKPVKVGVVNHDTGVSVPAPAVKQKGIWQSPPAPTVKKELGKEVVKALRERENLKVEEIREDDASSRLREGSLDAVLFIPANFSVATLKEKKGEVELCLEGTVPGTVALTRREVQEGVMTFFARMSGQAVKLPLRVKTTYKYGGEDFGTLDYFAPGFIGGFVFFFVFLLTSVSFLRERSSGTMERLLASPVSRMEVVLGYLLGFCLFAIIQSVVIIFFSVYVLDIKFLGRVTDIAVVVFLLTLGAVNLGIFLSFFARTELQVVQFIPLVVVPQFLIGGVIWPVETLIEPLQWLARLLPMTYAIEALRRIMLKGFSLAEVVPQLLFLVGFAILMVVLATFNLRREQA